MPHYAVLPTIAFLVGLGLAVWGYVEQRKRDAMAATPTLSCAEIAEEERPVTCEVKGAAVPGPEGAIDAPFSRRPCVWYHAKVSVRYEHHEYRDGKRHTTIRERTVHEDTYRGPFGVDDDTGQILVVHDGEAIDSAPRSLRHFEPAGQEVNLFGLSFRVNFSDVKGHRYEEWIVPPGHPMYVLGAACAQDGRLLMRRPDSGPFIVSAQSEEELSKDLRIRSLAGYVGGGVLMAGSLVWLAIKLING